MPIFAPVFCRGKAVERSIDAIALGARSGVFASVVGLAIGQHLFASNSSYGLATYLGRIRLITGSTVHFQFPSPRAYSPGVAIVPEFVWQAGRASASGGVVSHRASGIETLDTSGKELIHTRIREPRDYAELTIRDVDVADWVAYKAWLREVAGDGLRKFVAAYNDGDTGRVCNVVKLRSPGDELTARTDARVLRSWSVELQIIQSGFYL